MEFELGQTYSGYKFLDVAKRSKNGVEYRVQNTFAQRMELLKVLPQSAQDDQEETDRFMREMRVRARLVHPNIVTFFTAMPLEGRLVMTTELTEGLPLSERLKLGAIPWQEAVGFIRQVLSAVNCAHEQKIVHRDITPDNILAIPGGSLKLTNFRLAKTVSGLAMTQNGAILGNLQYISPEQVKGSDGLDYRSDLYSIGVLLYEMLAGRTPFHSPSQFELMLAHVNQQPDPPSKFAPSLPPQLDAIVLKVLAKAPGERYQSAREFEQALLQVNEPGTRTQLETALPAPAAAAAVEPPPVAQALVQAASTSGVSVVVPARPAVAPEPIVTEVVIEPPVQAMEAIVEEPVADPEPEPAVAAVVDEPVAEVVEVAPVEVAPVELAGAELPEVLEAEAVEAAEPPQTAASEPAAEPIAAAVAAEPAPEPAETPAAVTPAPIQPESIIETIETAVVAEVAAVPVEETPSVIEAPEPEAAAEPVAASVVVDVAPPAEASATESAPSTEGEFPVERLEPAPVAETAAEPVEASAAEPAPIPAPQPAPEVAAQAVVVESAIPTVEPAPVLLPEIAVHASLWSAAEVVARAATSPGAPSVEFAPVPAETRAAAETPARVAAPPVTVAVPTQVTAQAPSLVSPPQAAVPNPPPSSYDAPGFLAAVQAGSESVQWAFFGGTAAFLGVVWVAIWLVTGK